MRSQTNALRCLALLCCTAILACGTDGSNVPDVGTSTGGNGGTSGLGVAGSGGGAIGSGGRTGNFGSGGNGSASNTGGIGGPGTGGAGGNLTGRGGAGGASGTVGSGGTSGTTGAGGTNGRGGTSGVTGTGGLAGTIGTGGKPGTGGTGAAGTNGAGGGSGMAVPLDPSLLSYCTGTNPIVCAIPVPANGNYNVTVELGSATKAATTRVQAELLRIELQPTATAAGAFFQYTFTVNVRAEVHNVYSAPGKVLNLLFDGAAPALHGVGFAAAPSSTTIFVAGDSTVCDGTLPPQTP